MVDDGEWVSWTRPWPFEQCFLLLCYFCHFLRVINVVCNGLEGIFHTFRQAFPQFHRPCLYISCSISLQYTDDFQFGKLNYFIHWAVVSLRITSFHLALHHTTSDVYTTLYNIFWYIVLRCISHLYHEGNHVSHENVTIAMIWNVLHKTNGIDTKALQISIIHKQTSKTTQTRIYEAFSISNQCCLND